MVLKCVEAQSERSRVQCSREKRGESHEKHMQKYEGRERENPEREKRES